LQHLDAATQLQAKRRIVTDALTRIARLDVPVPEVLAPDAVWGYRSRITLALGPGRRWAGFHPLDQPQRVFDLQHCEIAAPALNRLWGALHPLLHLLPPDAEHIGLRVDREDGLHVVVKARGERAWERGERVAAELSARQVRATVWWLPERGAPRAVGGDREAFPATVFEQVHPALAERIRHWALDRLGAGLDDHVWDLYAGIGETTAALYARGATVESVELDRRAVDLGERRWHEAVREASESQRPAPAGVIRHVGRAEEMVAIMRDPHLVIANPPRAGLDRRVSAAVPSGRPRRLVYISCDPATLARDLARLGCSADRPDRPAAESRYRLTALQPFDLFPQTAHVETVAVLETG
jgi:23S rRNA (uracil1939-C5)-methyltransferase